MKKYVIATLSALLTISVLLNVRFAMSEDIGVTSDTFTVVCTVHDTIPYLMPVARDSVVVRYVTQRLPIVSQDTANNTQNTTISMRDTANVIIPITQKQYKDSTYTAWVSGYEAQLDSIKVYRQTQNTTKTVTIRRKTPPWSVGVIAGYGMGKGGLTPYVGVGVTYRLFSIGYSK